MNKTVAIVGAGAWGTAVATLLAENGFLVKLWCHESDVAETIVKTRVNEQYLPGIMLSPSIIPFTSIADALTDVTFIFEAVPVPFLRTILMHAKPYYNAQQIWIILSKGIEQHTLLLPSQIVDDVFGVTVQKATLLGPSFAHDLAHKHITAVTIAADSCDIALLLQKMLANSYFRPYVSLDMIGAQLGAALKNVIAIGIGMLDGAGYTDNVKAFFLTRGIFEMNQIVQALGGRQETIYGLAGVGDLVLTSMGRLSKNVALGKRIGAGNSLSSIQKEHLILPEGVNTAQSLHELLQLRHLDLPICKGVYEVLFENQSIDRFLSKLMARPLEHECDLVL